MQTQEEPITYESLGNQGVIKKKSDGSLLATVSISNECIASGLDGAIMLVLDEAGLMLIDNFLLTWEGDITQDNALLLDSLGINWNKNLLEAAKSLGKPKAKEVDRDFIQ